MAGAAPALLLTLQAFLLQLWPCSSLSTSPFGVDLRLDGTLAANGDHLKGPELVRIQEGEIVNLPPDAVILDAWYGVDTGSQVNITAKVQRQVASGNNTVHAVNELYGHVAPGERKSLQIEYVLAPGMGLVNDTSPIADSPRGVSVLVQIGNPLFWEDLKACASNVASAMQRLGDGFQVFLAFQDEITSDQIQNVLQDAYLSFGTTAVKSLVAENRGADIGLYLQQLSELKHEQPGSHFDLLLKVHTKTDESKRHSWLQDLCGTTDAVTRIYTSFRASGGLGMVGAAKQVVPYPERTEEFTIWTKGDMKSMKWAWNEMQPCVPFDILLDKAYIIAGSFFWARKEAVLDKMLLNSLEVLLASMPRGYTTNSDGQTSHALERLIPTMTAAVRGLTVTACDQLAMA